MKKILKNPVFMFVLGSIVFGTIGVVATSTITANQITYGNSTVESAINDLYTKAKPDYTGTVIYTPSDTTQTIPTKDKILRSNIIINQIPSTYKELSTLTNELTASDLLSGKQAYKADGTVVNGSISTFTPSASYTPTTTVQTLSTNDKYMNGNITIGAIPSNYKELSTATTVTANKLLSGETAYDNNGNLITGNINTDCVSGTYNHEVNTQWNIYLGFSPSRYMLTFDTGTGLNSAIYDVISNKIYIVRYYNDSTIEWNWLSIHNNAITSNFATTAGTYVRAFSISYMACK